MVDQLLTTQALGVAIAARVPVLLWGAPGTGKTSAIRALAEAMGWPPPWARAVRIDDL